MLNYQFFEGGGHILGETKHSKQRPKLRLAGEVLKIPATGGAAVDIHRWPEDDVGTFPLPNTGFVSEIWSPKILEFIPTYSEYHLVI